MTACALLCVTGRGDPLVAAATWLFPGGRLHKIPSLGLQSTDEHLRCQICQRSCLLVGNAHVLSAHAPTPLRHVYLSADTFSRSAQVREKLVKVRVGKHLAS